MHRAPHIALQQIVVMVKHGICLSDVIKVGYNHRLVRRVVGEESHSTYRIELLYVLSVAYTHKLFETIAFCVDECVCRFPSWLRTAQI